MTERAAPHSGTAPESHSRVSRSRPKLPLTLLTGKPKAYSQFPGSDPKTGITRSKARRRPAGRGPEAFDERFGAVDDRKTSFHILQPGVVRLGRVLSQGLLGVLELLN